MPFWLLGLDNGDVDHRWQADGPLDYTPPVGRELRAVTRLDQESRLPFDPSISLSGSATARVWTVTIASLDGYPVPTLAITASTSDDGSGAETVTFTTTGEGAATEFAYTAPDSVDDLDLSLTVEADTGNATASDTASITIGGNIPTAGTAPSLTGGTGALTLDFTDASENSTRSITSYDYEITDAADTGFAAVAYTGSVSSDVDVDLTGIPAGDYIARWRAVNAVQPGAWSAASTSATVT